MIQLRNLSTFEKNIILYLIGNVIQSSKVCCSGLKLDSFIFIVGFYSFSHIKLILLILTILIRRTRPQLVGCFNCSALTWRKEIVHRKYFYKSATLVREGMIIVHNAGLTGDTNNAEVDYHCLLLCHFTCIAKEH